MTEKVVRRQCGERESERKREGGDGDGDEESRQHDVSIGAIPP